MQARQLEDFDESIQKTHIDKRNGVIIPLKIRQKLGVNIGDDVSISFENNAVVIRKIEKNELISKRQNFISFIETLEPANNWSVEEFLSDKRNREY